MNLSVGIVGLPNVGKSTLFNALLKKQAALAANYPFATIEPNVGIVPVPDSRLASLAQIEKEENKMDSLPPQVSATVKFVDIAGLVKGASQGAGLGNKFLSHIREVSVIAHVVRAFTDPDVIREGSVDPKTDYETIETEMMLVDIETIQKSKGKKESASRRINSQNEKSVIERIEKALNEGIAIRNLNFSAEDQSVVEGLFLLSAKPEIVVLNLSESDYGKREEIIGDYVHFLGVEKSKIVAISAKIEAELSELTEDEQKQYLKDLGLEESGLERLIKKAYSELKLISFLTAGEKEVRAWTIKNGINAQDAAGVIHTDFIKNFIKAEIVGFNDFISNNGWKGSREAGKAGMEGKDYIMKDGDVVEFKIGK